MTYQPTGALMTEHPLLQLSERRFEIEVEIVQGVRPRTCGMTVETQALLESNQEWLAAGLDPYQV